MDGPYRTAPKKKTDTRSWPSVFVVFFSFTMGAMSCIAATSLCEDSMWAELRRAQAEELHRAKWQRAKERCRRACEVMQETYFETLADNHGAPEYCVCARDNVIRHYDVQTLEREYSP